jgi:hypothetical protein
VWLGDVLVTAQGSCRQPLAFSITTAGFDKHSLCGEKSWPKKLGLPFRATPGHGWAGFMICAPTIKQVAVGRQWYEGTASRRLCPAGKADSDEEARCRPRGRCLLRFHVGHGSPAGADRDPEDPYTLRRALPNAQGVNTQTCEVLHRFENCARMLRYASQSGR